MALPRTLVPVGIFVLFFAITTNIYNVSCEEITDEVQRKTYLIPLMNYINDEMFKLEDTVLKTVKNNDDGSTSVTALFSFVSYESVNMECNTRFLPGPRGPQLVAEDTFCSKVETLPEDVPAQDKLEESTYVDMAEPMTQQKELEVVPTEEEVKMIEKTMTEMEAPPVKEDSQDVKEALPVAETVDEPQVVASQEATEDPKPIVLDHEIQQNDQYTGSGEQFVAVRRVPSPADWCADCPTDVNINAEGVSDLVAKALQHLDRHLSSATHTLSSVLRVQRQAQIVNGVRYILLLDVNSNTCEVFDVEGRCQKENTVTSTCQVTFLEKPWLKLADGAKFRAVMTNNCTDEYFFGDNGEVLPNLTDDKNNADNELDVNFDSDIKLVKNVELLAVNKDKEEISPERLADLEAQIIMEDLAENFEQKRVQDIDAVPDNDKEEESVQEKISVSDEVAPEKSITVAVNEPEEATSIPTDIEDDKKEALDGLLDLFGFDRFESQMPSLSPITKTESEKMIMEKSKLERREIVRQELAKDPKDSDSSNSSEEKKDKQQEKKVKDPKTTDNSSNDSSSEEVAVKKEESHARARRSADNVSSRSDSSEEKKDKQKEKKVKDPKKKDNSSNHSSSEEVAVKKEGTHAHARRSADNESSRITAEDKATIHRLADLAVKTLDDFDADDSKRVVLQVLSAKKQQRSSSTNYQMRIQVGFSKCSESIENSEKCAAMLVNSKTKICNVQVDVRPNGDEKVVKSQCQNKNERERSNRTKRSVPGAPITVDPSDSKINHLAAETLKHYDIKISSSPNFHRIVKVIGASRQIVSGSLTKITYEAKESKCSKADLTASIDECQFQDDAGTRHCLATVWDRPWLSNGKEITVKCGTAESAEEKSANEPSNRTKRAAVGGATPLDPSDSKIVAMAAETLKHYDFHVSASPNFHKILKVIDATRQVVAGLLTKITFEAKESTCSKVDLSATIEECPFRDDSRTRQCLATVWERPWLTSGKEITVNCASLALGQTDGDLGKLIENEQKFEKFLTKFKKDYKQNDTEYSIRFNIFTENLGKIDNLNRLEQGSAIYGVTQFADLSYDEFSARHLGLRQDLRNENEIPMTKAVIPDVTDLPPAFDWRDKGAVTPVKNQGSCGSCWAFSVTGNIEGQWKIKNGNLLSLSEQELVDCDKLDDGCGGGLQDNAYRAIEQLGGLELETDYPYDALDEKCHMNKTLPRIQITGAVNISKDEEDMRKWLVQNGPMAIAINANAMQFYFGGVSHPLKFLCSPNNLDHGVLIVGYGIHSYPIFKKKMPFWIVKNSWGETWGEKGYYRVYRGDGTCGLNMDVSSAVV